MLYNNEKESKKKKKTMDNNLFYNPLFFKNIPTCSTFFVTQILIYPYILYTIIYISTQVLMIHTNIIQKNAKML